MVNPRTPLYCDNYVNLWDLWNSSIDTEQDGVPLQLLITKKKKKKNSKKKKQTKNQKKKKNHMSNAWHFVRRLKTFAI